MKIGNRIFALREERGLTQKDLSGEIGISRAALSHYENNRRKPDYETLHKIADYFGVQVDYLMGAANPITTTHEHDSAQGNVIVQIRHSAYPSRLL